MFLSQIEFVFFFVSVLSIEAFEVEISTGRVRGVLGRAHDGTPVSIFRGIPYARPPVGQLRWKAPEAPEAWNDVFDASEYGAGCIQSGAEAPSYIGLEVMDEDCLTLNVFTPDMNDAENNEQKFAVMVFFHGGGFEDGWSGNPMYHAVEIVRKGVIVVHGNYRLGIYGYMSTESDLVPGNFGMLDQIEVMKWVQENIHAFNGDKDRVTIFGNSAGGSSVSLHMLSPLSEGLFHNVIAQSGSSMCVWSVEPEPLKFTKRLADLVDCPTDTNTPEEEEAMVECLREIDAITLAEQPVPHHDSAIPFAPVVDGKFLTDIPDSLLSAGLYNKDVRLITGATKDEGFTLLSVYADIFALDVTYELFVDYVIPVLLEKAHFYDPVGALRDSIVFEYTEWDDPVGMSTADERPILNFVVGPKPWNAITSSVDAVSDGGIRAPMVQEALYHSWNGIPVWMYALDFISDWSPFKPMVPHGTENFYIFGMAWSNATMCVNEWLCIEPGKWILNERDEIFSDYVIDLWTNFAKFDDPTPDSEEQHVIWPRYDNDTRYVLHLDENSTVGQHYVARAAEYWNNYIYELERITSIHNGTETTTTATTPGGTGTTTAATTEEPDDDTDTVLILMWVLVGFCCVLLCLVVIELVAVVKLSKTVKTKSAEKIDLENNAVYKPELKSDYTNGTMYKGSTADKF